MNIVHNFTYFAANAVNLITKRQINAINNSYMHFNPCYDLYFAPIHPN